MIYMQYSQQKTITLNPWEEYNGILHIFDKENNRILLLNQNKVTSLLLPYNIDTETLNKIDDIPQGTKIAVLSTDIQHKPILIRRRQ